MPDYFIFILCLCVLTGALFTCFAYKKTLIALLSKTISSLSFVVLGVCALFVLMENGFFLSVEKKLSAFLLLLGLIVCLVGDMIIGLPQLKELKRDSMSSLVFGALFFALGHIIYCVALILNFGLTPLILCFAVPVSLIYTFGNKLFGKLNYKNLTAGIIAYSLLEGCSLGIAASSLILNGYSTASLLLLIGFVLFTVSDMVLMHECFGKSSRLKCAVCHGTYYPAQILIACSIMFIV